MLAVWAPVAINSATSNMLSTGLCQELFIRLSRCECERDRDEFIKCFIVVSLTSLWLITVFRGCSTVKPWNYLENKETALSF